MIEVKDNFLDTEYFNELSEIFTGSHLPWYMQYGVNTKFDGYCQMTHKIYQYDLPDSDVYSKLKPLFEKMKVFSLVRVKANLLFKTEKHIEHGYHVDITDAPEGLKTGILYMNTNNGYTRFENNETVESVANRLVTFPSYLKHSGSTNTCNSPNRVVININYFEQNK